MQLVRAPLSAVGEDADIPLTRLLAPCGDIPRELHLGCAGNRLGAQVPLEISVGPLARRFGTLRISALTLWAGTIPLVALSSGAMVAVAPPSPERAGLSCCCTASGPT